MSLAMFARGINEGIPTGIELGNAVLSGRNARGVQKANEIYAQMQTMGPITVHKEAGAIPASADGAETDENGMPVGYDGVEWDEVKKQYLQAMRGISDPRILAEMEGRLANLEKEKVMGYGRAAMQALGVGNLEDAQQNFAAMSYFMYPGDIPTIQMGADGTLFVQDSDGAGMAMKPDQIAEMMHQFVNFEDWRQLTFDKQRHADDMAYRNAVFAHNVAMDAMELATKDEALAADLERTNLLNEKTRAEIAGLTAAQEREEEKYKASLSAAEATAFEERRTAATEAFDYLLEDPDELSRLIDQAGGDDLLMETEEVASPAQQEAEALSEASQLQEAERQQYRSALRNVYDSNPMLQLASRSLLAGLAAGENGLSPEEIATIVLGATFEPEGSEMYTYDADTGTLRVGTPGNSVAYRIGEAQQPTLNALLGSQPEELPPLQGPPAPGAIPDQPGGM